MLRHQPLKIAACPRAHCMNRGPRNECWRTEMKAEYDFSKMKARKNPYASTLKKPVTIRLSEDVVTYFKGMAEEAGVPYQSLINLYLRDCLVQNRRIQIKWPGVA
jgi:uncharacterized protein (DUF4415 family)